MIALLLLSLVAFAGGDGPEITRSKGVRTGAIALYPRVTPSTDDAAVLAIADQLQSRIADRARAVGRDVDVRPAPERACPKASGCRAPTLGAVLIHQGGGCAVVFLSSGPGVVEQTLTPWAGRLALMSETAAFRTAPERFVTVADFAPCTELDAELGKADAVVDDAIRAAYAAAL